MFAHLNAKSIEGCSLSKGRRQTNFLRASISIKETMFREKRFCRWAQFKYVQIVLLPNSKMVV